MTLTLDPPPGATGHRAAAATTRWPDVATCPAARIRARIARRLFGRAVRRLDVRVALPDGRRLGGGNDRSPVLRLHRPDAFFSRLGHAGLIGFGESYQAGEWSSPDVVALLTVFARELPALVPAPLQRLRRIAVPRRPAGERATLESARRQVAHHYDLSNELFAAFLDETMTYSSALFVEGENGPVANGRLLADAQRRKIDRLLDEARVGTGTRLLEIGTGWGELAVRAARRGAHVRSVTLSREQQQYAQQRVAAARLADSVEIAVCDYRQVTGRFDAIVSVEMIEAVGYQYWPTYFAVLDRLLRPGGRVALQAITMPHERMLASRDTYTWIQKYVFPGGLIPSEQAMTAALTQHTSLRTANRMAFGPHYAETLRLWRARFATAADSVARLGFDEVFRRTWELYLAYSEAGFRAGYLDVIQLTLDKPGGENS